MRLLPFAPRATMNQFSMDGKMDDAGIGIPRMFRRFDGLGLCPLQSSIIRQTQAAQRIDLLRLLLILKMLIQSIVKSRVDFMEVSK